jgi:hypothetical protein
MDWVAFAASAGCVCRNCITRTRRAVACLLLAAVLLVCLLPRLTWACACGCDVFEVGTASLIPRGMGGTLFFRYDFADQHLNWHGDHQAPKANNDDKIVRSNFFALGIQYMFNRKWGVMAELPYTERFFKATNEDTGNLGRFDHGAIGDVRIEGMYTGFSEDMSTGIHSGLKFASGDFTYPHFDRDTSIGSGSTDFLLGAYHIGRLPLTVADRPFDWFVQANTQLPIWTQQHYQPGKAFNGALGALYDFGTVGVFDSVAPVLTFIESLRSSDHGANANTDNTGNDRLFIAPGAEVRLGIMRLYADAEFPIYQHVHGNQVVAPVQLKVILSYDF